jgi:oligosaccharide repeat unit polymerase
MSEILNVFIFLLIAGLSYGGFRLSRLLYGDYFAPLGLFLGLNLGTLSLAQLNLLSLIPISVSAYSLMALGLVSFSIGSLLASLFYDSRENATPAGAPVVDLKDSARALSFFYYLTATLGVASWGYYAYFIVPEGWMTQLWLLQGSGEEYVMPYHTGYFMITGALVPALFVLLWAARRKVSLLSVCFLILQLLALMLAGIKSYLVLGLSSSLLVLNMVRPNLIRVRHLVYLGLGFIGFMVLYDLMIDLFMGRNIAYSKFPEWLSFLERPYIYIAGPLFGMTEIIERPLDLYFGQITMEVVWKIFGPGGLGVTTEAVVQYLPFVNIGSITINVYSMIGEIFLDWGWFGVILGCLVIGYLSTRVYLVARARNNWILFILNGLFSYGIVLSFFSYYFRAILISLMLYAVFVGGAIDVWFNRRKELRADGH